MEQNQVSLRESQSHHLNYILLNAFFPLCKHIIVRTRRGKKEEEYKSVIRVSSVNTTTVVLLSTVPRSLGMENQWEKKSFTLFLSNRRQSKIHLRKLQTLIYSWEYPLCEWLILRVAFLLRLMSLSFVPNYKN